MTWDQIFQTDSGWSDWILAFHPGVNDHLMNVFASLRKYLPVRWKHHHLSSSPAHQDIIPGDNKTRFLKRQCGVQSVCQNDRQNWLVIISFRFIQTAQRINPSQQRNCNSSNIKHGTGGVDLPEVFCCHKGTCHPPTFCLLCIMYGMQKNDIPLTRGYIQNGYNETLGLHARSGSLQST